MTAPGPTRPAVDLAGAIADGRRLVLRSVLLAAIAAAGAGLFVASLGFGARTAVHPAGDTAPVPTPPPGPGTVGVPDVVGRSEDDAVGALEDAGFTVDVDVEGDGEPEDGDDPDATEPADEGTTGVDPAEGDGEDGEQGTVVSQEPVGGSQAPAGSTVTIRIGPPSGEVTVPDVAGLAVDQAEDVLAEQGFEVRDVTEEPSDETAEGAVIRSDPEGGSEVEPGIAVDLVVSTGPGSEPTDSPGTTRRPATTRGPTTTAGQGVG